MKCVNSLSKLCCRSRVKLGDSICLLPKIRIQLLDGPVSLPQWCSTSRLQGSTQIQKSGSKVTMAINPATTLPPLNFQVLWSRLYGQACRAGATSLIWPTGLNGWAPLIYSISKVMMAVPSIHTKSMCKRLFRTHVHICSSHLHTCSTTTCLQAEEEKHNHQMLPFIM